MKLEFKEKDNYTFVKGIIESNLGSDSIKQEVSDILNELPISRIEEAFIVLLECVKDLKHYKDSTKGLLVTDNKKDFWTL